MLRVRRVIGGCTVYDTDTGADVSKVLPRHLAEQTCADMIEERIRQFNAAGAASIPDKHKVTKASVNYRPAQSQSRECGACSMYLASGTCTLVQGHIEPNMVCNRFNAKIK